MKQSVSQQLKKFLQDHPNEWFASGELQRMEWHNRNRSLATPRSIVRRLQELTEEGSIHVSYHNGTASYSANPAKIAPKYKLTYDPQRDIMVQELVKN